MRQTRMFAVLATGGLIALTPLAASATSNSAAVLEASWNSTKLKGDYGTEDDKYSGLAAAIRWNLPVGNRFSIQLDVDHADNNVEGDEGNYVSSLTGTVHASMRSDSGLIGIFVGSSSTDYEDGDKVKAGFGGVEGQIYTANQTWYLQGGYLDDRMAIALTDGYFLRGVLRHFFSDNTRGTLQIERAQGTLDDERSHVNAWGIEIEHKPVVSMPLHVYLAYDAGRYTQEGEEDYAKESVLRLGVRVNFGAQSSRHNDRRGATLDAPRIGRWNGQFGGPLE